MKEKKKIYPNPKFDNVVDEDKYWKTHSPLAEGYPVEIQQEKQQRSSFLTIRLTGEELTQLRDLASSKGMGPSTYIRALIKDTLSPEERAELALSRSARQFQSVIQDLVYDKKARGISEVKDKVQKHYQAVPEAFCILEMSKSPFSQEEINNLTTALILIINQFISNMCVKVVSSSDSEFEEIKRITTERVAGAKK
jgi:hypothetical protein